MFKSKNAVALNEAMRRAYLSLEKKEPDSDEYAKIVNQLTKLQSMKAETSLMGISKDTLITITANLVGIALILKYEEVNIVTTRAINFVQKLR